VGYRARVIAVAEALTIIGAGGASGTSAALK
jgi:hypothetical protein